MKKAFEVLRDKPSISVRLSRDSVCPADDCVAHEKEVTMHSFTDPEVLAREASSGFLPNVSGIGHTWICELNGIKIAEIKCNGIRALVREVIYAETNQIHFVYLSAAY